MTTNLCSCHAHLVLAIAFPGRVVYSGVLCSSTHVHVHVCLCRAVNTERGDGTVGWSCWNV